MRGTTRRKSKARAETSSSITDQDDIRPSASANSGSVYHRLRDDILLGTLKPGQKVRLGYVRERYSAATSPVREALSRLSTEGLVHRLDHGGFFVAHISNSELRELVTTRCWLEELAMARSIANRNAEWQDRLVAAYERMSRTSRSTSTTEYRVNPDWEARHRAFHDALIGNCGSRWLMRFCRDLREQTDRYRHLATARIFPNPIVEEQHRLLMTLAIEGRAEEATAMLREHFQTTWKTFEDSVAQSSA